MPKSIKSAAEWSFCKQNLGKTLRNLGFKGQASLEFLVVLAVFASVFLLFASLASSSFELGVYSLDILKARSFLGNLENALQKNILFEGQSVIEEKIGLDWFFEARNSKAFIEVKNYKLGKSKVLSIELPASIDFNKTRFSERISLKLNSRNGTRTLAINN